MGASLLAKAVYQSTFALNDTPPSRAGSLPHGCSVMGGLSPATTDGTALEKQKLITIRRGSRDEEEQQRSAYLPVIGRCSHDAGRQRSRG
ncbi:hypothetical protein DM828_14855 [Pseudomonas umsongensis]|nr:hypothetical protein [Pseudomonas umsongensis]